MEVEENSEKKEESPDETDSCQAPTDLEAKYIEKLTNLRADYESRLRYSKNEIQQLKSRLVKAELRERALSASNSKVTKLQTEVINLRRALNSIFTEDQIEFLLNKHEREEYKWKFDTVQKSMHLYLACGRTGYKEMLRQGLPFPDIVEKDDQYHINCKISDA